MWLHGIETMALAVFTIYLIYFYSIFHWTYDKIIITAGIICVLYYAIKIVIMKRKTEREYLKGLTDIGEIVKK